MDSNSPYVPMNLQDLLRGWHYETSVCEQAQFAACKWRMVLDRLMGVPVVILTAVAATMASSLSNSSPPWIQQSLVASGVLAAILSSLQTFLGLPGQAHRNHVAGGEFSAVRWRIEQMFCDSTPLTTESLDGIRAEVDRIGKGAPAIPDWFWKRIKGDIDHLAISPFHFRLHGGKPKTSV